MTTRGRALRFTAVSALVVLGLTGFSTGRHGHGSDSGGGCSSSSQDHDSSSSSSGGDAYQDDDGYGSGTGYHDYDDDTYDDSGSGGGTGSTEPEAGRAEMVVCATAAEPYATFQVSNPNDVEYTFTVTVLFKDASGTTLTDASEDVTVPPGGTTPARVRYDGPDTAPDHCELEQEALEPTT